MTKKTKKIARTTSRKAKHQSFKPTNPIHPSILIPLVSVLIIFILIILLAVSLMQNS
ncbi:MAG: hypothetical protein Q8P80_04790 [Candidatus Levybacteria bacterium]|nr:hypothetical protein [Candidatus Levybacteria bacterium]